jgi:cytochrome c-type biogenesis protein CcmH
MTQFWIYAAGLIILAMAFIVLPLLRARFKTGIDSDELNLSVFKQQLAELDSDLEAGILDNERYEAAKVDLEKELLSDIVDDVSDAAPPLSKGARWMALSALLVPLTALLLYQLLGSPQIIQRLAEQQAGGGTQAAHTQSRATMEELVRRLAAKLEEQPNNPEGWYMLGRSYMAMNQLPDALKAFERAVQLDSENAGVLLAYAEAIAASSDNDFTGQAAPLVEKAYQLEPENPNALWMTGIGAYQQGDYQTALSRWEKLQAMLSPQSDNDNLEAVNGAIEDARKQLGLTPAGSQLPSIAQNQAADSASNASAKGDSNTSAGIEVKVSLSPALAQKASPDDLVFIYAKALSGPPMPLAAARKQVRDLPLTLRLDDSMAMLPQMKLSGFPQVLVGARVSLSGSPTAKSGDLEGEVKPVSPGQGEPVSVVIDSVHP